MSDTQEELPLGETEAETSLEVVEPQPEFVWVGSIPLFIGTVEDSVEKAKVHGFNVFFVLAQEKTTNPTAIKPKIFKVINNLIGYAIAPQTELDLGLETLKPDAWFRLPQIPWSLVSDINDFFREVYRKHGTEAIVMLTFDPIYLDDETRPEGSEPSDGWGVLVPKQTNTATACDYEPESVVDDKPDDVYIVGTCHSHPGMSAFCSGTDKKDQATFDGIHITYGWSKGSKDTEFHCELQLGGSFTMKPENIFLDMPEEVVNEKIEPWMERVEKKSFTSNASKPYNTGGGTGSSYGGHYGTGHRGVGSTSSSIPHPNKVDKEAEKRKELYINLPDNCPTPDNATVIAKTWEDFSTLNYCPCCQTALKEEHFKKVRCSECMVYLMWDGLNLKDLIGLRKDASLISMEIDPMEEPPRPIYIWEQRIDTNGTLTESVACIWKGQDSGKADAGNDVVSSSPGISSPEWLFCAQCGEMNVDSDRFCWECTAPLHWLNGAPIADEERRVLTTGELTLVDPDELGPTDNLCCDRPWNVCQCELAMEYDAVEGPIYDLVTAEEIPVYQDSACDECVHQYSASCPGYRTFLRDFKLTQEWVPEMDASVAPNPARVCDNWTSVEQFTEQFTSSYLSERE